MKTILSVILIISGSIFGFAQDSKKTIVAVLEFEVIGIDENKIKSVISDKITSELVSTERFLVVERTQIGKILDEYKIQQSGLVNDSTAVKIGNLLGAELLTMGSISKIGNSINIIIRFVDCQTSKITASKTARTEDINVLPEMIESMVKALVGQTINKKSGKNPKSAFLYSLVLPGTGQAYAGSSSTRVLSFSLGAFLAWGTTAIGYSDWKNAQKNADYLYSVDPTGLDPKHIIFDEDEGKDKNGTEWRRLEDENLAFFIALGVLTSAVHIWSALDASSQAVQYNKQKGFYITCRSGKEDIKLVFSYSF